LLTDVEPIQESLQKLILLRSLNADPLLKELTQSAAGTFLNGWYGALLEQYPDSPNPWAEYLWTAVKKNENFFSLAAERQQTASLPAAIQSAFLSDLQILAGLLRWQPGKLVGLPAGEPSPPDPGFQALMDGNCSACLHWLGAWYARNGAGIFSSYASFAWNSKTKKLRPVSHPDPITLDGLIGYQSHKQALLQNTKQFLKGLPANNVLLYGDRGTGKSSLVKALGNHLAGEGLRMVEVNKDDLGDFPELVQPLSKRGLKFIIFVDDLSFESSESQYKHLKAVLEGGLASRPQNLLIYATSNRRHLIRETLAERDEDLHFNDAVQEKLSLADRFGLTITFSSPDQAEYLAIVQGLAAQRGIRLEAAELNQRAIQWERFQNGRSGRTAKQFIDHLQGELELERA
jgi:predicted AAA+ superfamily ATPase